MLKTVWILKWACSLAFIVDKLSQTLKLYGIANHI